MKASEARENALKGKLKALLSALDNAGLTYAKMEGYGDNQTREKVTHWGDKVTVFAPDGRVVATVRIQTSRGWYSNFESYKLKVPTYQPRGDWHRRENRLDPSDPSHWGWGNLKAATGVSTKIKAALDSIPSNTDIEIGKLRRKIESLGYDLRREQSERKSAFRSKDVMQEVYGILEALDQKGQHLSDELRKNMHKFDSACRGEIRIEKKRKKLWAAIDQLEGKEAA